MQAVSSTLPIGLLLSGGLDSSILLSHLLAAGNRVQPFYIRSNLVWQQAELSSVRKFCGLLMRSQQFQPQYLLDLTILELPLDDLYGDHWSVTGRETPNAETPDDAVYLPGRNPLLVIKAALWCGLHGVPQLALASLAANPFADAGDEFFATYEGALNQATRNHADCSAVRLLRPFAQMDKVEVMKLGSSLPLDATFSCISPIANMHCGGCNKCAERQTAFRAADMMDPTFYAQAACV